MPSISIIMPVYNASTFLNKGLSSLLNQTLEDIEIVCVNDSSTDNSLQILQDFAQKDKRIVVLSQPKSGPAKARNTGLQSATGEYIMFCDSDDWYEPDMCEKMVQAMKENSVDFAMCNTHVIDEVDGMQRADAISYYENKWDGFVAFETAKQKKDVNVTLWSKIFKKSLIDEHQISFPNGCLHDDDAFVFQYMAVAKNGFFLNKRLYNYFRREKDSIMASYFVSSSRSTDRCKVTHFCYDWLKKQKLFSKNEDYFFNFYVSQVRNAYFYLDPQLRSSCLKEEQAFLNQFDFQKTKLKQGPVLRAIAKGDKELFEIKTKIPTPATESYLKRKLFQQYVFFLLTLGLIKNFRKQINKTKQSIDQLALSR